MLTTIAFICSIFFMIGGAVQIIFNLKEFSELIKGIPSIIIGLILFLLCRG